MAVKKPTGLGISRNGRTFKCTWKRGQSYNKKQKFKATTVSATDIGKAVTSKSFKIELSNYYPNQGKPKLKSVSFSVKGKHDGNWSAYNTKSFSIEEPNAPTVTANPDDNIDNRCEFSWSVVVDDTSNKYFIDCEYQSMLVADSNTSDGSTLDWTQT